MGNNANLKKSIIKKKLEKASQADSRKEFLPKASDLLWSV